MPHSGDGPRVLTQEAAMAAERSATRSLARVAETLFRTVFSLSPSRAAKSGVRVPHTCQEVVAKPRDMATTSPKLSRAWESQAWESQAWKSWA